MQSNSALNDGQLSSIAEQATATTIDNYSVEIFIIGTHIHIYVVWF